MDMTDNINIETHEITRQIHPKVFEKQELYKLKAETNQNCYLTISYFFRNQFKNGSVICLHYQKKPDNCSEVFDKALKFAISNNADYLNIKEYAHDNVRSKPVNEEDIPLFLDLPALMDRPKNEPFTPQFSTVNFNAPSAPNDPKSDIFGGFGSVDEFVSYRVNEIDRDRRLNELENEVIEKAKEIEELKQKNRSKKDKIKQAEKDMKAMRKEIFDLQKNPKYIDGIKKVGPVALGLASAFFAKKEPQIAEQLNGLAESLPSFIDGMKDEPKAIPASVPDNSLHGQIITNFSIWLKQLDEVTAQKVFALMQKIAQDLSLLDLILQFPKTNEVQQQNETDNHENDEDND